MSFWTVPPSDAGGTPLVGTENFADRSELGTDECYRVIDDIDAINFTLGVRSFDVAHHQPHPPGYPVLIAAGKMVAGTAHALGGL